LVLIASRAATKITANSIDFGTQIGYFTPNAFIAGG
jgi:hypothetical protein